ncbi:MAG: peptidoglycan D,D-transpeptidase FtsI family protein [Planctomycetota bacterium]|jgi:cell division protein FtsI (penicillin-binding protein 3)
MMLRARRLLLVFGAFLFLMLGGLVARLVQIQVMGHRDALERELRQSEGSRPLLARRGALLDRHGTVLADSHEALSVELWSPLVTGDPLRPRAPEDVADRVIRLSMALEGLLEMPAEDVAARIASRLDPERGVNVRLGAPVDDPERIDWLLQPHGSRDPLRTLDVAPTFTRRYPCGRTAGSLLGFVTADGRGGAGLEHSLQALLACGVDGRREDRHVGSFRVAAPGRTSLEPIDGLDAVLTIDVVLQRIVEQELGAACERLSAVWGSAVMLDVATGDILAMASVPDLDPSDSRTWTTERQMVRPAQALYSPGSTFKPVMMAAALELGLVDPWTEIDCSRERGRIPGRRKLVRDTHPVNGKLTLEEIIVHSSNVGMANIVTSLVPEDEPKNTARMRPLDALLRRLGIARSTGIPIAAESAGMLTPLSKWSRPYTLVALSFGHEVAVTPLQMAAVVASLADGRYRRPRLVSAWGDGAGGRVDMPVAEPVPVFSRATADLVRGYMVSVLEKGQSGSAGVPGLSVAGKTGTTVHETEPSVHDPAQLRETHSFVSLVPDDAPRIALVVVIDQPDGFDYASQTVAPVTGAILNRAVPYLGIHAGTP